MCLKHSWLRTDWFLSRLPYTQTLTQVAIVDNNTLTNQHPPPACDVTCLSSLWRHGHSQAFVLLISLLLLGGQNAEDTSGSKLFGCPTCQKKYSHKRSLWKHLKFVCGKPPTFVCPYMDCGYKGKLKENLKQHLLFYHNERGVTSKR